MSGQDHQFRRALAHLVDHGGGFRQPAPAPDSGDVAGLEQMALQVTSLTMIRGGRPGRRTSSDIDSGCPAGGQQDETAEPLIWTARR
jgi:hypothetical protein